jgi:hypothetical protein
VIAKGEVVIKADNLVIFMNCRELVEQLKDFNFYDSLIGVGGFILDDFDRIFFVGAFF